MFKSQLASATGSLLILFLKSKSETGNRCASTLYQRKSYSDTAPATVGKNVGCITTVLAIEHGKVIEQSNHSLTSPETGLSLCRQTAGCGVVLVDSFCLYACVVPHNINYKNCSGVSAGSYNENVF